MFAYGSNMDSERMSERGIIPIKRMYGEMRNWKLVFNKKSQKLPGVVFANIIPEKRSIVEGVLYEINIEDLEKLDKFEGHPEHYTRYNEAVYLQDDHHQDIYINCWVYIANFQWIGEGRISVEYLNHILKCNDIVSETYYNKLLEYKNG
jgi:gamma-glutamylcyclotransferase (GGCT)/AIG2-like uncharacterized protein YtfP